MLKKIWSHPRMWGWSWSSIPITTRNQTARMQLKGSKYHTFGCRNLGFGYEATTRKGYNILKRTAGRLEPPQKWWFVYIPFPKNSSRALFRFSALSFWGVVSSVLSPHFALGNGLPYFKNGHGKPNCWWCVGCLVHENNQPLKWARISKKKVHRKIKNPS